MAGAWWLIGLAYLFINQGNGCCEKHECKGSHGCGENPGCKGHDKCEEKHCYDEFYQCKETNVCHTNDISHVCDEDKSCNKNNCNKNNCNKNKSYKGNKGCKNSKCGIRGEKAYKTFNSGIYNVTFEYPASWVQNKNYSERFEGANGFFEVAEISALGRTIDEVVEQEISSPISPYGSDPKVEAFVLGGESARIILPSTDQEKVFERETALIVKNKKPVIEGQEVYNYTIIWSDKLNMQRIIETFKFS